MKLYLTQYLRTFAAIGALAGLTICGNAFAQQSSERADSARSKQTRSEARSSDDERRQDDNNHDSNSSARLGDDEVRLRYNDKEDRLSIDVDEDIRVPERSGQRTNPDWAREGKLDLRYDTDKRDLEVTGGGTIDVDRAANSVAKWWQSWWEEEKSARRSQQEGAASGARHFIREHDENNDGYLARRELPANHRKQFARVDRNDDGFLSRTEVQQYGVMWLPEDQDDETSYTSRSNARGNQSDETWSEWWASWWYDENSRGHDRDTVTADGASEFIRQHDGNGDGALVRSEMPERMYDDFDRLDINDDRYLTRQEILRDANRLDAQQTRRDDLRSIDR